MERTKYILIILTGVFLSINLHAGNKSAIYEAYISNRMDRWKAIMDEMGSAKDTEMEFLAELVNYQYGYIGWCMGNNQKEQAEKYLAIAGKNLKILESASFNPSLTNAYKSAFYGFRIGLNAIKAPFLGPRSVESAKLAVKLDENNPMGYIQLGNAQFYMPVVFGGSKALALEYFKKAEKLMEQDQNQLKDDWNYLSLLIMIAQAHTAINDFKSAKMYYEKILKLEPRFTWVKNELYPEFLKKTESVR